MAVKELGNLAVSIFCRNMSMLISAGIDAEESVGLLADDAAANDFRDAAKAVQNLMLTGQNLMLHGLEGVSMTALLTCSEILGFEHIKQIIN